MDIVMHIGSIILAILGVAFVLSPWAIVVHLEMIRDSIDELTEAVKNLKNGG